MSRIEFFFSLLTIVCLYSTVKGGAPERWGGLIFVVGVILTIITGSYSDSGFTQPEVGILICDVVIFLAFLALALNAERYWTLWICSMQMIQVLSHIPIMFIPELLPQAYYAIVAFWGYPMLIVLAAATYRHQQRLRQFGVDRSWSDYSF
ncbi:hypothetical protein [Parasphingorhabdus sp.]|uniref:hypothetical protein n=1 Tax=Parasphingorhabdus sp. TaxID=2709688 RepID=UPI00326664EA